MLGSFLRLKIAIVLAVLGLLVLGTGIGQRTIWRPPATLTAAVSAEVKESPAVKASPLTVIGPGVLETNDGQFTMTVKSDGPIQLAVGRMDDVFAWIDDASYTILGGVSDDLSELNAASTAGVEKVPNPSGSDLWVSEEKADGELTYTWQAPARGDWALLLSSDGTAPAPIDISVTTDNDAATPWAIPLMIIGSALLALAALLFFIAPRKPKQAEGTAGRRSAGRTPTDPATGALEVDKIVAARSKRAPTATDSSATDSSATRSAVDAKSPAADADAASALPATLTKKDTDSSSTADSEADAGSKPDAGHHTKPASQPNIKDHSGDDAGPSGGTPSGAGAGAAGSSIKPSKDPATDDAAKDAGDDAKKNEGKAKFTAPSARSAQLRTVKNSVKARWGAVVAAALLAGSISPAVADDTTAPAPEPSASAPATDPAATEPAAPEGTAAAAFPNLLDSQVERIAASVAAAVAAGDNAKDAKELAPRVAGMALAVRTSNYKIRATVAKHPAIEPVEATQMLAQVVTNNRSWPRSSMVVTQGESNKLPQLLTLVQENPRENYLLIQATPLLPGQTFPKVDKEGTAPVPLDSTDGLLLSPKAAIAKLTDRLTASNSKYKDSFNDSVYIASVLALQKKIVADAKDASYVFSHKPDLDSALAMRTADGGAMVVVGNDFGIAATSKDEATLKVGEDAAAFTGGRETVDGFTLNYAEPVVMYIPPAEGDGKITILSATRNLVDGKFK